jgi:hypothetical protein
MPQAPWDAAGLERLAPARTCAHPAIGEYPRPRYAPFGETSLRKYQATHLASIGISQAQLGLRPPDAKALRLQYYQKSLARLIALLYLGLL